MNRRNFSKLIASMGFGFLTQNLFGKNVNDDLCRREVDGFGTIRTYNKLTNKLHSFNGEPATIYINENKYWYKEGKVHRDNDLPAVEHANGVKCWYKEGLCHRDNLPAIEALDGNRFWYKEGKIQAAIGDGIDFPRNRDTYNPHNLL